MAVYGCCGCSGEPASDDDSSQASSPATSSNVAPLTGSGLDGADRDRGLTTTTGSTGSVELSDFFAGGFFYAKDSILRAHAHPECVVYIESAEKPLSAAGTLWVSSDLVGTPGGPPAPLAVTPDGNNSYGGFPDLPLFNFPDRTKIQVALAGAPEFPAVHATLRSPLFPIINVTAPLVPASGVLAVSSTTPLTFTWDVPPTPRHAGIARHPQHVSAQLFVLSPEHWGHLFCSWPVEDGHGKFPAVLLREFRRQLGGTGALDANIDTYSGEFRELATATSSYVFFTTTDFGTTLPRSTSAMFE